jgi:NADPH-dependent 2,4-dienoyl-CoA reductase/sulfur reductase-like enzyme
MPRSGRPNSNYAFFPHWKFCYTFADFEDQEAWPNEISAGGHNQCAVNPGVGFEGVLPAQVAPGTRHKRVAVVGPGPAGIVWGRPAAERGHAVTLFEKPGPGV